MAEYAARSFEFCNEPRLFSCKTKALRYPWIYAEIRLFSTSTRLRSVDASVGPALVLAGCDSITFAAGSLANEWDGGRTDC